MNFGTDLATGEKQAEGISRGRSAMSHKCRNVDFFASLVYFHGLFVVWSRVGALCNRKVVVRCTLGVVQHC